jgi:tagatose 6-phosphate kinase
MVKHNSILTVTLNPSIDTLYKLTDFQLGKTNRCQAPVRTAGGKGLNVTRVIRQLGENVAATGFLGGDAGAFIRRELVKLEVQDHFVEIDGLTRTCLAFVDTSGEQTEVLEQGPAIAAGESDEFKKRFLELVKEAAVVVVSGSLPKGMDSGIYQFLLQNAREQDVKLLLDTSGQTLMDCLSFKPFMIKPNLEELEQITGKTFESEADIWQAINQLEEKGVSLVIVTNGAKGAFVSYLGQRFTVSSPMIETVSAVGSGDSFVAGMAVGLARNYPIEKALTLASVCGAANAKEERTGHIEREWVEEYLKRTDLCQKCD